MWASLESAVGTLEQAAIPGPWQLALSQQPHGYRFALDAFLLADFVSPAASGPFIDLGTGCGVVALLLARRFPYQRFVGLELQSSLVRSAQQNVTQNDLQQRVWMVQGDIRQACGLFPSGTFATVICNPPYRALGHGRLNPCVEKAIARHEVALTLSQLLQAVQHLLGRRGVLAMVYHPARLAELLAHLETARLRPRRLRLVHATWCRPASMVLLDAVHTGGDRLTVLPPLCVYDTTGVYTAEIQAIFRGRALSVAPQEL
jgi:tRNA1Val (adenine37-N6)-methyltransferase